ncbi:HAD family hydrolase [Arabiibacter massiliensis]|uniref:HAD family hydrolase n=1 Tax=Arabiibacter massiliensis TaxID=1870985 RepID=UPI0009BB2791|nr:HAD family hydrolase [Arabiibacter massiliensis]
MGESHAPKLEAFVFDLDGTLLDTLPDLVLLTNAVLRECGYPERTSAEILSFVGNGVKALMYQAVPEDADAADVEAAMRRWKELYPAYGHKLTKAYDGIPETVAELKRRGARLGVLSNKFDGAVREVIGSYLPGLFEVAHGECAEFPRKPDPAGLLRTIDELGATPATTAYVGDSAGDIAVSRNAGAFAIAVAWGYHEKGRLAEARPDALIGRAGELLRFAPSA